MSTTTFDTLGAAKDLQSAGMETAQAEAVAMVIQKGQGDLATKSDLAVVRADLENVRAELKNDINWLKWVIGFHVAITIAGFAAILALLIK